MHLRYRGLRELDRALRRGDRELHTRLRRELLGLAASVATEAQSIAASKGLRESGDLIRKIAPFARANGAGVRSSAMHRGFAYPRRLEFEGRGASPTGPRATLNPALADKRNSVFDAAERLLDDIADELGRE